MSSTISIARGLCAEHPEAALPCPVCAASLKARNLDRHLTEVHAVVPGHEIPSAAALELVGVDRRIFWWFTIPGFLFVVVGASSAVLQATTGRATNDALLSGLVALLVASFVPLGLAGAGRFRAQLVLDERRVELRYTFGLQRLEVRLPATLETGGLWQARQTAGMAQYEHSASEDMQIGSYLRLSDANAALIIGATASAQLRKHWAAAGLHTGPRRKRWDITLDLVSLVKLQYHLAALRLLTPA